MAGISYGLSQAAAFSVLLAMVVSGRSDVNARARFEPTRLTADESGVLLHEIRGGEGLSGNGDHSPDEAEDTSEPPHVRVEDTRLRDFLFHHGLQHSPLLRQLVSRLENSDVVVYVRCDERPPAGVIGRVAFVSRTAGVRYLLVRVGFIGDRHRQTAVLGHELQHAVEIADSPAIVDRASMYREYSRMGYVKRVGPDGLIEVETDLALQVGGQILKELRHGSK